ncbi:hypothetical protein MIR68_011513 [Amoeboaphelidium protococcarum]|nr:hypothetical protein MIR68_011513 [Amoeboaphelidium protococcarum]
MNFRLLISLSALSDLVFGTPAQVSPDKTLSGYISELPQDMKMDILVRAKYDSSRLTRPQMEYSLDADVYMDAVDQFCQSVLQSSTLLHKPLLPPGGVDDLKWCHQQLNWIKIHRIVKGQLHPLISPQLFYEHYIDPYPVYDPRWFKSTANGFKNMQKFVYQNQLWWLSNFKGIRICEKERVREHQRLTESLVGARIYKFGEYARTVPLQIEQLDQTEYGVFAEGSLPFGSAVSTIASLSAKLRHMNLQSKAYLPYDIEYAVCNLDHVRDDVSFVLLNGFEKYKHDIRGIILNLRSCPQFQAEDWLKLLQKFNRVMGNDILFIFNLHTMNDNEGNVDLGWNEDFGYQMHSLQRQLLELNLQRLPSESLKYVFCYRNEFDYEVIEKFRLQMALAGYFDQIVPVFIYLNPVYIQFILDLANPTDDNQTGIQSQLQFANYKGPDGGNNQRVLHDSVVNTWYETNFDVDADAHAQNTLKAIKAFLKLARVKRLKINLALGHEFMFETLETIVKGTENPFINRIEIIFGEDVTRGKVYHFQDNITSGKTLRGSWKLEDTDDVAIDH